MGIAKAFGLIAGIGFSSAVGQPLPNWNPFPGSCKQIGIVGKGNDQAVPMCVTTISYPWGGTWLDRWSGNYSSGYWAAWSGGTIARVATDSADNPWVTMDNGGIWQWTGSAWQGHTINGWGAREIAMAGSGSPSVWAISNALYGSSTTDYWIARRETNGSWTWVNGAAREIAVDMADGLPNPVPPRAWVVDSWGNVHEWVETLNSNQGGWRHHPYVKDPSSGLDIPGLGAIDIAAGHARMVYIVGNDIDQDGNGSVWKLNQSSPTRKWDYMYARGKKVALSHSDNVFVIKADNSIIHLYTP